jgi:hypothetical protein
MQRRKQDSDFVDYAQNLFKKQKKALDFLAD